jgi:hypothetical protein
LGVFRSSFKEESFPDVAAHVTSGAADPGRTQAERRHETPDLAAGEFQVLPLTPVRRQRLRQIAHEWYQAVKEEKLKSQLRILKKAKISDDEIVALVTGKHAEPYIRTLLERLRIKEHNDRVRRRDEMLKSGLSEATIREHFERELGKEEADKLVPIV